MVKRTRLRSGSTRVLDMPLERAMRTQRAMRRLRRDPVDDDLLLHILELALHAPNGGNRQNVEFLVLKDRAAKDEPAPRGHHER